jgi:hypothetical protein
MNPSYKKDLVTIHKIYSQANKTIKENKLPFHFKPDDGDYETRIDISETGLVEKGNGELPKPHFEMFCPDLIDFKNKRIIEYEEEAKKHSGYLGAKPNKGHFPELLNKRDDKREKHYKYAGFDFLKIWEGEIKDGSWYHKLKIWLLTDNLKN